MTVNLDELPMCAVRGLVAPRAMCACVVMGGRCGTKGPCEHKMEPKPAAASWPYDSEGTPVDVERNGYPIQPTEAGHEND